MQVFVAPVHISFLSMPMSESNTLYVLELPYVYCYLNSYLFKPISALIKIMTQRSFYLSCFCESTLCGVMVIGRKVVIKVRS